MAMEKESQKKRIMITMAELNHEVVALFQQHLLPLSNTLTEMLNEHYSHQTERRGCGYT